MDGLAEEFAGLTMSNTDNTNPTPPNPPPADPAAAAAAAAAAVNMPAGFTMDQWGALLGLMNEMSRNRDSAKKYDVNTKKPDEFTGDAKKARAFLEDCELQFAVNPHKFSEGSDDARLKVGYALSFCTQGVARDFATLQFEKYKETKKWDHWETFVEIFKKQFVTIDEEGEALQELTKLRMGSGTADEYVGKFKLLASRAKITEDKTLIHYFLMGLNKGIYKWLINVGVPDKFEALCKNVQE